MIHRHHWRKSSYSGASGGNCVEVAQVWRKSSYSGGSGGNCVEVAQTWRKSSYSNGTGGSCLEVAASSVDFIPVRDSKDTSRGHLMIPAQAWTRFADGIK